MHEFGVVCRKSRFPRQIMTNYNKLCLVLCVGLIRNQNQKLRPLSDLFQCHNSSLSIRFVKQATIEMHSFRGNPYYIILYVILVYILLGLYFENRTYLWNRFDK